MIPYDDLVAALQTWRARQGLPVAAPAPGSGPRTASAAPALRTTSPTSPPPAPGSMAARQPVLSAEVIEAHDEVHEELHEELHEEVHEVEEGTYESEGNDFAMSFAGDGHKGHVTGVNGDDASETMLGHDPNVEPDRPSDLTDPGAAQRNGRDDW